MGRMVAPGRLLCSSHPALSLDVFSLSPLMPVGCIQWDFKGAWNAKTPGQPDREWCCAQMLPLCGTNINLAAGTGMSAIHHCTAVSAALPLEQPLQLFSH